MTITLALGAAFASLVLLFGTFGDVAVERRRSYLMLRSVREASKAAVTQRDRELAVPAFQRIILPALRKFGSLGSRLTPEAVLGRLDDEIAYAGNPAGWDGERVLALKFTFAMVLGFVGLILPGALTGVWWRGLIGVIVGGMLGYYIPEWVLRSRSGDRQKQIQRSLPDALDLMSITVEAGLAFDAALERTAREMGGPLGDEFYRVHQEMRLGKSRAESLRDLGERSPLSELRSFVLAMVQADIFGIPIARVLHVQSRELRIKRRQRAEEQAQKLPVKIIFPLILCIFPSLFIVLLGPAAINIYESLIRDQ